MIIHLNPLSYEYAIRALSDLIKYALKKRSLYSDLKKATKQEANINFSNGILVIKKIFKSLHSNKKTPK